MRGEREDKRDMGERWGRWESITNSRGGGGGYRNDEVGIIAIGLIKLLWDWSFYTSKYIIAVGFDDITVGSIVTFPSVDECMNGL